MDLGLEGGFLAHKSSINSDIYASHVLDHDENYVHLKKTGFETVFANDIFNQNRTRLQSIFGNVNIANNTDSRNFGFTINYKIPTKNKLAKEDPNLINNQENKDDNGGLIPQGQ